MRQFQLMALRQIHNQNLRIQKKEHVEITCLPDKIFINDNATQKIKISNSETICCIFRFFCNTVDNVNRQFSHKLHTGFTSQN
jgi:hypothetical protein